MWIRCTERLPPAWTTVLCYTNEIVFGQLDEDVWRESPYDWEIKPSHWMPLPPKPDEDHIEDKLGMIKDNIYGMKAKIEDGVLTMENGQFFDLNEPIEDQFRDATKMVEDQCECGNLLRHPVVDHWKCDKCGKTAFDWEKVEDLSKSINLGDGGN